MRLFFLPVILSLTACSSAGYLVETGIGQWKLFNRARPISEVLASPFTPESSRRGIEVVNKAKVFAVSSLGLKATKNYETFVQLDAPCVSWAVSASHPLRLEEKKWSFPFVGEVPYIGFFTKQRAEEEARRIAAEGALDTWVRCVPAFSSLGWFSDPLYSSMINGRDHQIAELVVHESLHATVWVKGGVDFNEKLANFVGLEGSVRYMENEKGVAGVQLVREEVRGEKIFADFMKGALDLYRSSVKNQDDKAKFYGSLSGSYASFLEQKRKSGEKFTAVRAKLDGWNNAALLAYANYYSDFSVLEKMLAACKGDLGRFVAWISKVQREAGDEFSRAPEDYLGRLSLCP